MTATNHVLAGAIVGATIHQPWIALPVAIASHFACDALPHFDYPTGNNRHSRKFAIWLAADVGFGSAILASIWFLQPYQAWLVVLCGAVSASVDAMWIYYLLYKPRDPDTITNPFGKLHHRVQRWTAVRLWPLELLYFVVFSVILIHQLQFS